MRFRPGARPRAARQTGFTMIEILVTLLIITIGVLGTAGLQAFALKVNQGGQLRSQAVVLAIDLVERIEANNGAAITGGYAPTTLPTTFSTDCGTTYCTEAQLATYDLVAFNTRLQTLLPGSSATITVAGTGPFTYTITISWSERITKTANTTVATTGAATAQAETFSYTIIRMFQNRSLVV